MDLLPTIQYCASYFSLPANVDSPAIKNNPEDYENMELEEYCSFQTFDPNMYLVVTKRFRDFYIWLFLCFNLFPYIQHSSLILRASKAMIIVIRMFRICVEWIENIKY